MFTDAEVMASQEQELLMRSTADFKALRDARAPGQFESSELPGADHRSSLEEAVVSRQALLHHNLISRGD